VTKNQRIRMRLRLFLRQRGNCALCGEWMNLEPVRNRQDGDEDLDFATIDHRIPQCRGGSDEEENLQLTHKRCNEAKADQVTECETTQATESPTACAEFA
jgi:5-methylcytosine-specific restriction endonuclease McrA